MDNDGVAILQMQPRGILEHDLFVNCAFGFGKLAVVPLQCVMELFCAAEEAGCALYQMPLSLDANRIHHQGQRRQNLSDAATVKSRADMGDMHGANTIGFPEYSFCCRSANERLVILDRMQTKCRSLDS